MTIDTSISIGAAINAILLIVTLAGIYWKMRELVFKLHGEALRHIDDLHAENSVRLIALETKVGSIWSWWTQRLERREQERPR